MVSTTPYHYDSLKTLTEELAHDRVAAGTHPTLLSLDPFQACVPQRSRENLVLNVSAGIPSE